MPAGSMEQREEKLQDKTACQCADKAGLDARGAFLIHGAEQQEGVQHEPVTMICLADHAVSKTNGQNYAETKRKTRLKCIRFYLAKQFP